MKPLAIAIAAILAAGAPVLLHAETGKPQPQAAQPAPAHDAVRDWLVIQDTTYIPVIDDVSRKLAAARTAFLAKDATAAATDVREAAQLLAEQEAKVPASERNRLVAATRELDRLAADLDAGRVNTVEQFDAAYAKALRADVVLRHVVIDESVWLQLTDEPQHHFGAAAAAFAKNEYKHAAEEIRKGEAFIELEAIRAGKDGRNALNAAAAELKKLATSVEKGSVKDGKALEAAFAKAEHALALSHRVSASESWLKKEFKRAGAELEAAAQHVENAAAWVGAEVKAGALAAAADARALGDKLRSGAAWTRDEVAKGFESLGNAIDAVGKKDGGNKV